MRSSWPGRAPSTRPPSWRSPAESPLPKVTLRAPAARHRTPVPHPSSGPTWRQSSPPPGSPSPTRRGTSARTARSTRRRTPALSWPSSSTSTRRCRPARPTGSRPPTASLTSDSARALIGEAPGSRRLCHGGRSRRGRPVRRARLPVPGSRRPPGNGMRPGARSRRRGASGLSWRRSRDCRDRDGAGSAGGTGSPTAD